MRPLNLPPTVAAMLAATVLPSPADALPEFVEAGRVAGCGQCNGGGCGACGCSTSPPGKVPCSDQPNGNGGVGTAVPMVVNATSGDKNLMYYEPGGSGMPRDWAAIPANCGKPYVSPHLDAQYMTKVVGTATIAAGATATVRIEPTQGCFDGFYVTVISVDNAAPNNRGRVLVARWFVGDCPGDCRSLPVWSDVYDGTGENGCCVGVPFRTRFGRSNNGEELRVDITNPAGGFTNANVQVIVTGVCHRGSCAC